MLVVCFHYLYFSYVNMALGMLLKILFTFVSEVYFLGGEGEEDVMLGCFIEPCYNGCGLCAQLYNRHTGFIRTISRKLYSLYSIGHSNKLYSHQFLEKCIFTAVVMEVLIFYILRSAD
jgi:hypothetical protein